MCKIINLLNIKTFFINTNSLLYSIDAMVTWLH